MENPLTHQPPLHEPPDIPFHQWIFGEEVILYGGDIPTRIVRENGDVYDLELTQLPTTAGFFEPTVVHTGHESHSAEDFLRG